MLALRCTEHLQVQKVQADQIEENKLTILHLRSQLADNAQIIRNQEAELLERAAQLQAQTSAIRALRRQHAQDADALRAAHEQIQSRFRRASHSPANALRSPAGHGATCSVPSATSSSPPRKSPTERRELQQALQDKLVLVRRAPRAHWLPPSTRSLQPPLFSASARLRPPPSSPPLTPTHTHPPIPLHPLHPPTQPPHPTPTL